MFEEGRNKIKDISLLFNRLNYISITSNVTFPVILEKNNHVAVKTKE